MSDIIRVRGGENACTSGYTAAEQKKKLKTAEESVMIKVDNTQKNLVKLPDSDTDKVTHYRKVEDANNYYKILMKQASDPYKLDHSEITQIWKWFTDKTPVIEEILEHFPISEFPTASVENQRKCQVWCKNLFSEFRSNFFKDHVIDKNFAEDKVYPVKTSDLKAAADLMMDMNRALSFEGIPTVKGGSAAQQKMHYEINEAVHMFCDTYVWPEEVVSLKSRIKHFVVAKQMDDSDIFERLIEMISTQKKVFPDSDFTDILHDMDRADEMLEQQKQQIEQLKASDTESYKICRARLQPRSSLSFSL